MKASKPKVSRKAGLPPGTLIHIGEKKTEKVKIKLFEYNEDKYIEQELETLTGFVIQKEKSSITWLNIEGIHQVDIVEKIGNLFNLHSLILEDIVNTEQFPKIEDYSDHLFIVLKTLSFDEKKNRIETEQVSLCMGTNFVLSFQEAGGKDFFNPIYDRIRKGKGRIRKMGADYLLYSIIDAIVDSYFIVLEKLDEKIETLEESVLTETAQQTVMEIHKLKREMILLRKSIWPLREIINNMGHGESSLITESVHIYLRDVYDHTVRIIETIENFRDILSGLLDIYLSNTSNRINSVMKVLTIIATIFMPLTFIAGIYGMNFEYMPELEWRWGYPTILTFMASLGISMLIFFRLKKWL